MIQEGKNLNVVAKVAKAGWAAAQFVRPYPYKVFRINPLTRNILSALMKT